MTLLSATAPLSNSALSCKHRRVRRTAALLAAASLLSLLSLPGGAAAQAPAADAAAKFSPAQVEFFAQQVLPVLQAKCFKCHGGEPKVQAGFRITSRAGVLRGGELGPAVDLENPGDSQLLAAIRYEGLEMPPQGKLPATQAAVLTRWVKEGLPWSGKEDYGVAPEVPPKRSDGRDYWAYQPLQTPPAPEVANAGWPASPLDAFVLRHLEDNGLQPAAPAPKLALLRRAYYDLIGLPPSPEEVDAFLNDDSPEAFEKVVDHLLGLPQYGERWGRHWLDLVRYAETHGYERDSPKPEAWRYRDYVIQSFNADKPYDQFVIEQLAGDQLPEVTLETLTATGFYRLGVWDDEPADRLLARYDGLDDILKTTSEAVLGTTMGCVRCHTHKADPFEHREYYQLLAYFHDISDGSVENLRHWATEDDAAKRQELLRQRAAMQRELADKIERREAEFRRGLKELGVALGEADGAAAGFIFPDSRKQKQTWEYTTERPSDDWMQPDYSATSWEKGPGGFGAAGTPGAVVGTPWTTGDIWLRKKFTLAEVPSEVSCDLHHDEDCQIYLNGVAAFEGAGYLTEYRRVPLQRRAVNSLHKGENVVAIHCRQTGGGQYIDAGLALGKASLDFEAALGEHGGRVLGREQVRELREWRKQLENARKERLSPPGIPVMAVAEQGGDRPVHVLIRGNPHSPSDEVQLGVPAALGTRAPELAAHGGHKRLAIARWMFQDDNPLSARVLANRLWQHHFGRGIVPTPNDFGKLGEPPTHPQLLDYLAGELRSQGWRLKPLHKQIMLSAAYRMGAQATPEGLAKDPLNHHQWRFNRRRLSAEEIRDSMLSVTGELNLKQGGPSIFAPIPAAVLQGQSRPGAGWGKSSPTDASRRSVYIHLKRSLLVPILEMHDQADTDSSCPVRYNTTVATQSLGMLNGEFTNERAARLAERLRRESPELTEQVRRAIRLTTGREPSPEEIREDAAFVESLRSAERLTVEQSLKMYALVALNANEFLYLD